MVLVQSFVGVLLIIVVPVVREFAAAASCDHSTCYLRTLSDQLYTGRLKCTTEEAALLPTAASPVLKDSSLALSVVYKNHTTKGEGELVVEWSYQAELKNLQKLDQQCIIDVSILQNRYDHDKFYKSYYTVNNSIRKMVIGLGPFTCTCGKLGGDKTTATFNVSVQIASTGQSLTASLTLDKHTHCWEEMGARSLEICGVQIPSAPLNLSARLEVDCSLNTTLLSVDWSPPALHNTPILAYHVEIQLPIGYHSIIFSNTSFRTSYPGIHPSLKVRVRAGFKRVANVVPSIYEGCEQKYVDELEGSPKVLFGPGSLTEGSTSCPPPSSSPVEAGKPSLEYNLQVILPVAFSSALLLVLVISAVVVLLVWRRRKASRYSGQYREEIAHVPTSPVNPGPVFLVSSPEESEETQKRLRHLVHDLADHGIAAVYYQYERAAQHAASPGALGIARWVEHQFQRCDLVLFACTRTFSTEWSRENGDVMIPVVWSSRHVLDGILPHQDDISRFGVVLMGDNCDIPPSLRRFQVFPVFQRGGGSEAVHTERLVEYIYQTPLHAPPPVSRASAVRASL